MTATVPKLRASSLRDCGRKALYEGTGTPSRDLYERERRTMFRGKSIGRDWLIMYASTHELKVYVDSGPDYWVPPELLASSLIEAGIVAEVQIPWTYGVGHADAFIVETGTIIEVLSSAHASEEMKHSKILQATLYMEHYEAAKAGALIVVSPTDLEEEVFPIAKTSASYRELVAEMRARIEQVQTWSEKGTLPDRVCRKPADARSHFCRFDEPCFADWEPPALEEIATTPEMLDAVEELRNVQQERSVISRRDKQLKTKQKDIQGQLDDIPVGDSRVGRFEVKKQHTDLKPKFDWEKAEMAGVFEPGLYEEFFTEGSSYDKYTLTAIENEDFGDVPWTDEDLVAPVGATERTQA